VAVSELRFPGLRGGYRSYRIALELYRLGEIARLESGLWARGQLTSRKVSDLLFDEDRSLLERLAELDEHIELMMRLGHEPATLRQQREELVEKIRRVYRHAYSTGDLPGSEPIVPWGERWPEGAESDQDFAKWPVWELDTTGLRVHETDSGVDWAELRGKFDLVFDTAKRQYFLLHPVEDYAWNMIAGKGAHLL